MGTERGTITLQTSCLERYSRIDKRARAIRPYLRASLIDGVDRRVPRARSDGTQGARHTSKRYIPEAKAGSRYGARYRGNAGERARLRERGSK